MGEGMGADVRVTLDAKTPSQPWATVRVEADGGRRVTLQLRWRDGEPVADLGMAGDGDGSLTYTMLSVFRDVAVEGDEWKKGKAAKVAKPSLMLVVAALVPVGQAWEASPVRSADRLLGWVARQLSRPSGEQGGEG